MLRCELCQPGLIVCLVYPQAGRLSFVFGVCTGRSAVLYFSQGGAVFAQGSVCPTLLTTLLTTYTLPCLSIHCH